MPDGVNSQGNSYNTPGGTNSNQGTSYHYSNTNPPRAAPGDVPGAKGSPTRQYFPDSARFNKITRTIK